MTPQSSQTPAYELTQRELTFELGEQRTGYGITCFQYDSQEKRHTVDALYHISTNKERIEAMIALFNLCELPPDRFRCTVIDLIP